MIIVVITFISVLMILMLDCETLGWTSLPHFSNLMTLLVAHNHRCDLKMPNGPKMSHEIETKTQKSIICVIVA